MVRWSNPEKYPETAPNIRKTKKTDPFSRETKTNLGETGTAAKLREW
ncbi:hypothetical protein AB2N04_02005 [Nitratireductor sp. GISD-1A_MAKvit]